jgi:hypothetical protein
MTAREIAEEIGLSDLSNVNAALVYVPVGTVKDWHIAGYRRDEHGGRLYPRALYAAGPGVDARKPGRISKNTAQRRWRNKVQNRVASVFELGMSYRDRRKAA